MGNPHAQESADPIARVVRRFPAEEASQAVAVDDRYFYAIASAAIGKNKATGRPVPQVGRRTTGPDRALEQRCRVARRTILRSLQLSTYPDGELDRGVRHEDDDAPAVDALACGSRLGDVGRYGDGAWWVTFAHYSGRGGEPGKGSEATRLVRFTNDWRPAGKWTFPQPVVARGWGEISSSGGTLASRGLFYTTGHDAPELYVLKRPRTGQALTLEQNRSGRKRGTGLALDRRRTPS